jgi:hypothetical protein
MNRSKSMRRGVLLLAAFHIGVAATVPIADAMLELASIGEPLHIESEREAACGDGHAHVFCQLCRTVGLGTAPRAGVRWSDLPGATTLVEAPAWDVAAVPSHHLAGPFGARPPPLA